MIYFISNGNDKVKIGYSGTDRTFLNRMYCYNTHNPDTVLLDTNHFCNIDDEHNIKMELKPYKIGRSEWYYNIPEVHEIWERYKRLAENRVKDQLEMGTALITENKD